jgi:hypothetical protein
MILDGSHPFAKKHASNVTFMAMILWRTGKGYMSPKSAATAQRGLFSNIPDF